MQSLDGELTQKDYDKILARITELQLLEIMGEYHKEELERLKAQIEYEEE